MGNKRRLFGTKKNNPVKARQAKRAAAKFQPKRLVVLCQRAIKKYNLITPKKRLEQPTSSTVIGGKSLRERKKRPSVAELAEPGEKKRPRSKKPKLLPRKDITHPFFFRRESKTVPVESVRIKEEPELDMPADEDPLNDHESDTENYTVVLKEEPVDDEGTSHEETLTVLIKNENPLDTSTDVLQTNCIEVPIVDPAENLSHSSSVTSAAVPATTMVAVPYVLDEFQIFANSIAEQLRAFPVNRAMLLQLEIQTMIDNERQLLVHESLT